MKIQSLKFEERVAALKIVFEDKEATEIIPSTALVSVETDESGKIVALTIYFPENDAELITTLKENFNRRSIPISIPVRR